AACAAYGYCACGTGCIKNEWSPVVALAGMAYLRGGDPDFRSAGGTVTKPGVIRVCGRRAYFLVSVVASPALATWPVPAAAGYAVVFAGWNAAAPVAASGT